MVGIRLPHQEHLHVAEAKLKNYLLSRTHPDGGSKAHFLHLFGFRQDQPSLLRTAIVAHAATAFVLSTRTNTFGTLYDLLGPLPSPDCRNPSVHVIWMIDTGTTAPRLITLVPAKDTP
jgi:hypothetical protein